MCGIYFHHKFESEIDFAKEKNSIKPLVPRGPDQQELRTIGKSTTVGFTRLSIRSRELGSQPYSLDKNKISCINGELYNELEIRQEIESCIDSVLLPVGDMQLLGCYLNLYGMDSLSKTRGMFAGFIFDEKAMTLSIFRDRVGEKPLYYYISSEELIVSSDARCIEYQLGQKLEINPNGLSGGVWKAPESPFKLIKQVVPGSWKTFHFQENVLKVDGNVYWSWPSRESVRHSENEIEKLSTDFKSEVLNSVDEMLISDVPACMFLSGGLDSALVLQSIYELNGPNFPTFTLVFDDASHSEDSLSRQIAKSFKSNHVEIKVSSAELAESFPKMLDAMDIPILDPSCLALYNLSFRTTNCYKVALSGDGGDELFMGYKLFQLLPLLKLIRYSNIAGRNLLSCLSRVIPLNPKMNYMSKKMLFERMLVALQVPDDKVFETAISQIGGSPEILDSVRGFKNVNPFFRRNFFSKSSISVLKLEHHYQTVVLPDLYLQKSDRMTMANSQELRAPLLGVKVLESAMRFSAKDLTKMKRKEIIQKCLTDSLPAEVLQAPKHGFSVPLVGVLRELGGIEWNLISLGIRPELAERTLSEAKQGSENAARASFALIVLNHFVNRGVFN
jgi:asparagine synthase (glutamine-hydrolysing)